MKHKCAPLIVILFSLCGCKSPYSEDAFSNLKPQSKAESEKGFLKCVKYIEDSNSKTKTTCTYAYMSPFGEIVTREQNSIKHSYFANKSEYIFEEDPDYITFKGLYDENYQKKYEIDKSARKVTVTQKQFNEDSITIYKAKINTVVVSGTNPIYQTSGDNSISISSGDAFDAAIGMSGLALTMSDITERQRFMYFWKDASFEQIYEACNDVYYKVSGKKAIIRLRYNLLFEGYNEQYKSARCVAGSMGAKEGDPAKGWEVGQVTQEYIYADNLLAYYHVFFEFKGMSDTKFKFYRVS